MDHCRRVLVDAARRLRLSTSGGDDMTAKAAPAAGFHGFPKELAGFLRDLGNNNSKTWFDAKRAACDAF